MSLKKDKQKVIGPDMNDEQIAFFLEGDSPKDVNEDYFKLERAYRSLRADDFGRFVKMFQEKGRQIDATNPEGKTLAQVLSTHKNAASYLEYL